MIAHTQELMVDTNVFNELLDGRLDAAVLAGHQVIVTGVQAEELRRCKNAERASALLKLFDEIGPTLVMAASFMLDVEGAGFGQAEWSDGTGRATRMFERLRELDRKPIRKIVNQWSDIAIAETALKRGATLISNDEKLRWVLIEFGGQAVASSALV